MKQTLEEPEKVHTPLVDYIEQKLHGTTPSRRSILKGALVGILGGVAFSESRHAYASHIGVTDILDDSIGTPNASLQEYLELENIATGDVSDPPAGRGKIFRNSADDMIYVKYPDGSIVSLETPVGNYAFLDVIQTFTAKQTFEQDTFLGETVAVAIRDTDAGIDTIELRTAGQIMLHHTSLATEDILLSQVVAGNNFLAGLKLTKDNVGGPNARMLLIVGPNSPTGTTGTSSFNLIGAMDPGASDLEYLRMTANNPGAPGDREFTLGPQVDGTGTLRPFILVMGANEMIELLADLSMDFKSRAVSNLVLGNEINVNSQIIGNVATIQTPQSNNTQINLDGRRTNVGNAIVLSSLDTTPVLTPRLIITGFANQATIYIDTADLDMSSNEIKEVYELSFDGGSHIFGDAGDLDIYSVVAGREFVVWNQNKALAKFIVDMDTGDVDLFGNLDAQLQSILNVGDASNDLGSPNNLIRTIFSAVAEHVTTDCRIFFDDTGETDPLGEFNFVNNNDLFLINGRNALDSGFESIVTWERIADGGEMNVIGSDGIRLTAGPLRCLNISKPTATSNTSFFYAKDVSASSEAFALDESDNEVQLTTHNFTMFTPSSTLPYPWSYYARNEFLGIELSADIAQALTDLGKITNKDYIHTRTFQKKSWANEQVIRKQEIDEHNREMAQLESNNDRDILVKVEMDREHPKEVAKEEAIESLEIEEKEGLTTPIYDEEQKVIGEDPIMIPSGEYQLNPKNGNLEPMMKQESIVVGTRTEYKMKKGYWIDRSLGKFYRKKTKEEAELIVPKLPVNYPKYTIKAPPQWMQARGVN